MNSKPVILLVDDEEHILDTYQSLLSDLNVDFLKSTTAGDALKKTIDNEIALILLDVGLPDMSGFEVAKLLKQNTSTKDVPIIFITAKYLTDQNVFEGYESGAVDFILKPAPTKLLRSKVKVFIELYNNNEQKLIAEKERYKRLFEEKLILLQELHHRVKNNLNIIVSLLYFQSFKTDNPEIKALIKQSETRVLTISYVHEILYHSSDLTKINIRNYCNKLLPYLYETFRLEISEKIDLVVEIDDFTITLETAIPCGLIITELLSNSFLHGFKNQQKTEKSKRNEVCVECRRKKNGEIELSISDNGVSLPTDFITNDQKYHGLELVRGLATQLDSNLNYEYKDGFKKFSLIFKEIRQSLKTIV